MSTISFFQPKHYKTELLGLVAKKNMTASIERNALAPGPSQHLTPHAYTV
jgi:hypothetical protein